MMRICKSLPSPRVGLLLLVLCIRCAIAQPPSPISPDLRAFVTKGQYGQGLSVTGYANHIYRLYTSTNYVPLWIKQDGLSPQASYLLEALRDSRQKGLNPTDYDAEGLASQAASIKSALPADQAAFDARLSLAVMRYISDLRIGRVNPKHLNFFIDVQAKKYDLPDFIQQQIVNATDMPSALSQIEPPYGGYRRIEATLKDYLALAAKGDGEKVPTPAKTVAPGESYSGIPQLTARLRLLGDLPPSGDFNSYTGALVDGVKHFQERHGLDPDGKLGAATIRVLNVPLNDRVQEIDDALERWRWMPTEYQEPPVLVNVPEFHLRAYDDNMKLALNMRVVVGKAAPTRTPVFTDTMRFIVFRPYWNVPSGILDRTVIPNIRKNSGYIAKERFEVTDSSGRLVNSSSDLVAGLQSGKYAIRQKPGPANALGLIKFMFPNSFSVYLHSTPSTELFAKSRRDFSSGCIRVEKPAELGSFVLRKQPDGSSWTAQRVQAAMDSGKDNVQVNLAVPVPVLILYQTAVAEEDGTVHFFDDIYGHDKKLNAVLAKGPPYP